MWGAMLAAGSEAVRRFGTGPKAEAAAIAASQAILKSFQNYAGKVNCREITDSNLLVFFGRIKYMLTGKAVNCARMAVKWSPLALEAIKSALENVSGDVPDSPLSCTRSLARKMGASDEEAIMAAGFTGGIGLSGGACGALAAAIWITTSKWYRQHPEVDDNFLCALKHEFFHEVDFYPAINSIKAKFQQAANGKYLCGEIAGRKFDGASDHAAFLSSGGCSALINALAADKL